MSWSQVRIVVPLLLLVGASQAFVAPQAAANPLTPEQRAAGWRLLFDGADLSQWRLYNGAEIGDGWQVRDGAIEWTRKKAGDLITRKKYDSFELSLDYKISPAGNSGLMFHVVEGEKYPWQTGPEVQIQDNLQGHDPQQAGWLYQLYPAEQDATRPAGEWNTLRILVTPERCAHWLNGVKYCEYVKGSQQWDERVAASKFSKFANFGKATSGHICLQDHGNPVAFRNLRIREIGPFGPDFPHLDSQAAGRWWEPKDGKQPVLRVPRDQTVAFALYSHDRGLLKLSAQLYPLLPEESRTVRLQFQHDGQWSPPLQAQAHELGWSAHFRVENWEASADVPYRVLHGDKAEFTGLIRHDPIDKDEIVVAVLSCNSSRTAGPRATIVENLQRQDPDLLLFAGDQTYHHTEHTFGWLEFGAQFREVLRNRPVIAIPDDHDVGQGNLWGEGGKQAESEAGNGGGYYYPVKYVQMVERCQTWHLPDPPDPAPIQRGIGVYFTNLRVGGIDFAIIEDRKFKSGPRGKIPPLGPRPDHINDPAFDRQSIDLPGLELLGQRQLEFLHHWGQDWTGARMKAVLSQTAFCGAVHLHGNPGNRLLADLDCNGWPQAGRNEALREIRRAGALHLCGDQHLAVLVQHGIDDFRDGPFGFTVPAIVNTIYGRWWHPLPEQLADRTEEQLLPGNPLPWTGDFLDGLGNRLTMHAYANPGDRSDETQRGDGYGIVRFRKSDQTVRLECWPRFADVRQGDAAQYPGWPVTLSMDANDGRQPVAWLPTLEVAQVERPVVQVIDEATGEIVYTRRAPTSRVSLPVFRPGVYSIRVGGDLPDKVTLSSIEASPAPDDRTLPVRW